MRGREAPEAIPAPTRKQLDRHADLRPARDDWRSLMSPIRWTADRMDQLEHAARRGLRVALSRRGTEYIVVALRVTSAGRHEVFVGRLPMTGEELTFRLGDIDSFQVIE